MPKQTEKFHKIGLLVVVLQIITIYICLFMGNGTESISDIYKHRHNEATLHHNLNNVKGVRFKLQNVDITGYNNVLRQTDSTPDITASQRLRYEGMIAISRDFQKKYHVRFGDYIYIEKLDSWFVVEDVLNKRFSKRIDVFTFDEKRAREITTVSNIIVFKIDRSKYMEQQLRNIQIITATMLVEFEEAYDKNEPISFDMLAGALLDIQENSFKALDSLKNYTFNGKLSPRQLTIATNEALKAIGMSTKVYKKKRKNYNKKSDQQEGQHGIQQE